VVVTAPTMPLAEINANAIVEARAVRFIFMLSNLHC
jgi:hypothetical protein